MLKFQAVAEKTAKNFRRLLFCRTLHHSSLIPTLIIQKFSFREEPDGFEFRFLI